MLELEPEELAGYLIEYLNALPSNESGQLNRCNFGLTHIVEGYPREYHEQIQRALMEAWIWLEREGMLAPKPGQQGDWVFITRRGKKMRGHEDSEAYRKAALLPRRILHPVIAQKVWTAFLRGDYDTAVFQAFNPSKNGPLVDNSVPLAEQEALMMLFAGAIGSYKNPSSHRHVGIGAEDAVEMIMLASHLLRIVDARTAGPKIQHAIYPI